MTTTRPNALLNTTASWPAPQSWQLASVWLAASSHLPLVQALHAICAFAWHADSIFSPTPHVVHALHAPALVSSEYVPPAPPVHAPHTVPAKPYPFVHRVGTQSPGSSRPPADVIDELSSPAVAWLEHGLQSVLPSSLLNRPAAHDLHAVVDFESLSYRPTAHALQAVAPWSVSLSSRDVSCPASHALQLMVIPFGDHVSGPHKTTWVAEPSLLRGHWEPAAHDAQYAMLAVPASANSPAVHGGQLCVETRSYVPFSQGEHCVWATLTM